MQTNSMIIMSKTKNEGDEQLKIEEYLENIRPYLPDIII